MQTTRLSMPVGPKGSLAQQVDSLDLLCYNTFLTGADMTAVEKLEKALASVNEAIEELYYIDGMEEYAERLNYVAVEIEGELEELQSLESK
jgi:hypothetical protein